MVVAVVVGSRDVEAEGRGGSGSEESGPVVASAMFGDGRAVSGASIISTSSSSSAGFDCGWVLDFLLDPPFSSFAAAAAAAVAAALLEAAEERLFVLAVVMVDGAGEFLAVVVGVGLFTWAASWGLLSASARNAW